MQQQALEAFAAFVGLDWAEAIHALGLQAAGTARREFLVRAHRPEAIEAWVQTLRPRFHGQPVAVGLARHQGPRVSALRASDCLGLCPIHPFTLAKDRAALPPSPAKDAPPDAARPGARLLTHRATRTPLSPQSPTRRV